ncbi:MAG TPA: RNA-binding protein [Methanomicrobiales archaeon]|nr:RNA-binding protein [Methanomicrobiales archaeon]
MAVLTVKKRHTIRKDELSELFALLRQEIGDAAEKFRSDRVELAEMEAPFQLYLVDRKPLLMRRDGWVFPTVRGAIERPFDRRTIAVDMGAVPFLAKGADVMRPGVVSVTDDVKKGSPAIVVDERHRKPLAVVVALLDGPAIRAEAKGKMAKTIHHVGDLLWALEL